MKAKVEVSRLFANRLILFFFISRDTVGILDRGSIVKPAEAVVLAIRYQICDAGMAIRDRR